jgi:hypothetical protein
MKHALRRLLDPGDDGRAFTEAVLLKASGALFRRRQAAESRSSAFDWLERWARPWLVTAVLALGVAAALVPLLPGGADAAAAEPAEAALLAAPQPEEMLVVTIER